MIIKYDKIGYLSPYTISSLATISTIIFASIACGCLLAFGKYDVLVAFFVGFLLILLWLLKSHYLIYYYLLFGSITYSAGFDRIGGLISLTWARNTLLAGIYFAMVLAGARRVYALTQHESARLLLLAIFPFTMYAGVSIIWSWSPLDGLRYFNKFLMAAFFPIAFLLDKRISSQKALRLIFAGAVIFIGLSIAIAPLKSVLWGDKQFFQGISGRHVSKYYLVFIAILGLVVWNNNRKKYGILLLAVVCFASLVPMMQRGALVALFFGLTATYIVDSMKRRNLTFGRLVVIFVTVCVLCSIPLLLFKTHRFESYMFYEKYNTSDFVQAITENDYVSAFDMIQTHGRMNWLPIVCETVEPSFAGEGFGSMTALMTNIRGKVSQLHNDFLQYFYELGYFGFLLYLYMFFTMFRLGLRFNKASDPLLRIVGLTVVGYTTGLFVWAIMDHVIDYAHVTSIFWFCLAAIGVKREMEIANNQHHDHVAAVSCY